MAARGYFDQSQVMTETAIRVQGNDNLDAHNTGVDTCDTERPVSDHPVPSHSPAEPARLSNPLAGNTSNDNAAADTQRAMVLFACPNRALDMAGALAQKHYQTSSAGTFDALREICAHLDVLIMELVLPDVDGIEIIRFLGQQVTQPELIFVSDLEPRIVAAARRLAESKGLRVRSALPMQASIDDFVAALSQKGSSQPTASKSPIILTDHQHLRRGMANDEFVVHYQPKIDVKTLGLVSVEALVRWRHPDYGMLGPNSFVPLAEQTGLISPLTEIIVEKAFEHACTWRDSGIPLKVAVNISGASLADLSLPDQLSATARKFELSPDSIVVEITESWVVKNPVDALDILTRLRMKGFNLSIDDFGTGYSSMLKLKQIPFSELKLDQSIIRGAANDADARAIVETSIELGQRLGLHLVAEGVEHQEDWDLICELGCDEGQGFFIARPMNANDLPDWHNRWNLSLGI